MENKNQCLKTDSRLCDGQRQPRARAGGAQRGMRGPGGVGAALQEKPGWQRPTLGATVPLGSRPASCDAPNHSQ